MVRVSVTGTLVVLIAVAIGWTPGAAGGVMHSRACGDVRVDRSLRPTARGDFGAFGISAVSARCAPARVIARRYVEDPFAPTRRVTRVGGWRCGERPDRHAAQQVLVTCTRGDATVRFADRVPNG